MSARVARRPELENPFLSVHTDGGCLPSGRGAWAYLVSDGGRILRENSGLVHRGTDSLRMEITAVLEALESLSVAAPVVVHTDSRILVDLALRDVRRWRANGWRRKSGREVFHRDLLERLAVQLDRFDAGFGLRWKWVKAHAKDLLNQRCDELCREAYSRKGTPAEVSAAEAVAVSGAAKKDSGPGGVSGPLG